VSKSLLKAEVALIVCTRNRKSEVIRLLKHIDSLDYRPGHIFLVDSSEEELSRAIMRECSGIKSMNVHFVDSLPGAPHQKNVGIQAMLELESKFGFRFDFVSFMDDDIIPSRHYFREVVCLFQESPGIFCLGGFDTGLEKPRFPRAKELIGIGSRGINVLLPNGLAIAGTPSSRVVLCDWVPGGMQNYRREVVDQNRFDGTIRIHGDEVEFQLRLESLGWGSVACSNALAVFHGSSLLGKAAERESTKFLDGFRWRLALTYPNRFKRTLVLFSTALLAIGEIGLHVTGKSNGAFDRLMGHLDFFWALIMRLPTEDKVYHAGSGPFAHRAVGQ
jgi:GT2 family glycosyltransferase